MWEGVERGSGSLPDGASPCPLDKLLSISVVAGQEIVDASDMRQRQVVGLWPCRRLNAALNANGFS